MNESTRPAVAKGASDRYHRAVHKTAMRIDAPTVFLVGIDERLGGICFSYFDDVGVRIIAVRNVAAACERLTKLMPSVVVVPAELSAAERAQLSEHAAAAGSEIAPLAATVGEAAARAEIAGAFVRAQKRREPRNDA